MRKSLKLYLPIVLLLGVLTLAYLNFENYQPKVLRRIQEVKGLRTAHNLGIPCPQKSQKISSVQTTDITQVTFRTEKTPEEVQEFYTNISKEKEWKTLSQSENENFFVTKYKRGDETITVLASKPIENELTLASVEITNTKE